MAQVWPKFVTITPSAPWDAFDGLDASITKLIIQNQGPSNLHGADRTTEPTTEDRGWQIPDVSESWDAVGRLVRPTGAGEKAYLWVLNGYAIVAYQPDPEA